MYYLDFGDLIRQLEVHRNLRLDFDRKTVQHVGLVLPIIHRIDRGTRQTWCLL